MIPTKTADLQPVDAGAADNGVGFPIVGVGASAGGLAATTDLLRHLGPRPGLAVVVVHHLDPSHDSSLVDIFSRVTPLPVAAVTDRTPVESNHVYVVPPNAGLGIAGGRLDLTPRLGTGGLHLPIDRFLESLARDRTDQAIGVVLTGTGADGALGIRAIKAEGGITFAQDASAEYRSMPESAIGTGCVDFILPPDAIARELTRIGARAQLRSSPVEVEVDGDGDREVADEGDLRRILSALTRSSGIDFANYKHTTLRRRIQRRVVVNGLDSLAQYAALIEEDPHETRALCEEVLIHVTSFTDRAIGDDSIPEAQPRTGSSASLEVNREADRIILAEYAPPGIVVTNDLAVVQFRGRTGPFLEPTPGVASLDLLRMVREELRLPLRQLIDEARAKQAPARRTDLMMASEPAPRRIELEVIPFRVGSSTQRFFIVLFCEVPSASARLATDPSSVATPERSPEEHQLKQELAATRDYLTSVIERSEASDQGLKAANEEIASSNEELRSTNRYSESVLDNVHAGLLVLDGELRVRSANRTFRRLFTLTDREIGGRHLDEIARGEWNSPALKRRLQDLGEEDRIEGYRVELESGGERRVFALNGCRIEQTPQILLALEEVTDKERAERALQRTESGFREMLTTIAEAILMTDGAGRIVFANEMAGKMFGYATKELVGLSVDALLPERMRGRHTKDRSDFMVAPSTRRMGRGVPPLGRRKDGGEFPLEVVLGSMQQEGGPLVMSFISDISARLEAERKLHDYRERLQRMAFDAALAEERERRRIAADLHDRIGQSLALAQITLTSVRETISGAPRVAIDQAVDLLAQSATDTRTLIFDLSPPILHDLGFKAALSWLVEDLQKRHRLEVMVSDDGADDALDDASATLLFRAVRELLLNVFKHAQTPSATVSMHRRNHLFEVEVEDRGIGFDANDIGAPSGAGGFGLFSVREQIGRLGGNMEVTSAPREGSRIRITVPTKSKSAGDAPSSAQWPKETQ